MHYIMNMVYCFILLNRFQILIDLYCLMSSYK
uniref:Uncharacterized protein n=1 Tax=Arundo donax TaxID=35708 RepID=A0A0A9AAA5_ARUDO